MGDQSKSRISALVGVVPMKREPNAELGVLLGFLLLVRLGSPSEDATTRDLFNGGVRGAILLARPNPKIARSQLFASFTVSRLIPNAHSLQRY